MFSTGYVGYNPLMPGFLNQYIPLSASKPGLIYSAARDQLSQDQIQDFQKKFKNFGKLFIELGSGSGGHILELAGKNPDALCVGIEKRFKRAFRTGEKAEEQRLKNIVVLRTDLKYLETLFPENSVERVYVNYPDPWEKKKWLKNRMLSPHSLVLLAKFLKPGGLLRYKTDHRGYFEDTLKILKEMPEFSLTKESFDLFSSEFLEDNITTEFEMLFRYQGLPTHFVEAVRNN